MLPLTGREGAAICAWPRTVWIAACALACSASTMTPSAQPAAPASEPRGEPRITSATPIAAGVPRSDSDVIPEDLAPAAADDLVFFVPQALPEGITVLHIGDSFAAALGRPLNRELERRGVHGVLEYETSTYIATWASSKPIARYLERHRPDLVLITLGANELDAARLESRAALVRKLVRAVGARPCVWIAPALRRGARPDLLRIIEDNCAPCAYFDSDAHAPDLERKPDGIHPTRAAGERWAQALIEWLDSHPPLVDERRWVSLEP